MSTVRRVVTGHRADGKSIIASDTEVTGLDLPGRPGTTLTTLWGADDTLTYPDAGGEPRHHAWFPPVGGFRFIAFVLPPDRLAPAEADPQATAAEVERLFPGLLATMLPEEPGMHRSATVDVLYVVAGRCVLELDDGSKTELGAGDVVVQSGTMHRWHNPWAEPCRIIGLLVGARLK
ncbi:MAG TPA: cupin domain-containing protein [Candidatus Binatia bacterium]|nr:cupin domain-containing protein [Candidatus Binatia bacterium]